MRRVNLYQPVSSKLFPTAVFERRCIFFARYEFIVYKDVRKKNRNLPLIELSLSYNKTVRPEWTLW